MRIFLAVSNLILSVFGVIALIGIWDGAASRPCHDGEQCRAPFFAGDHPWLNLLVLGAGALLVGLLVVSAVGYLRRSAWVRSTATAGAVLAIVAQASLLLGIGRALDALMFNLMVIGFPVVTLHAVVTLWGVHGPLRARSALVPVT